MPALRLAGHAFAKEWLLRFQASLPPAKISLPRRVKIVQLSAGLHHTLMLSDDGEVYGFGSNSHGQLGQVRTSGPQYHIVLKDFQPYLSSVFQALDLEPYWPDPSISNK